MSAERLELQAPALFDFLDSCELACRGADQEWFRDSWQRRAGCGPTTAATCLSYLAQQNPALAPLLPRGDRCASDFAAYMEAVWEQVTPNKMGLNSLELYWRGALEFAALRGCTLRYETFELPGVKQAGRPSAPEMAAFLEGALRADRPVAFLNFSNGALENLESWHWVPLIWLARAEDTLRAGILDEGLEKEIDLGLWHRSTRLGGGFVTLWGA